MAGKEVDLMRVSEVMIHDPVCCTRTTSVRNAVRMMRAHDIGFLPVIDELWTQKLIGVVTDRDLYLAVLAEEHNPTVSCGSRFPLTRNALTTTFRGFLLQAGTQAPPGLYVGNLDVCPANSNTFVPS